MSLKSVDGFSKEVNKGSGEVQEGRDCEGKKDLSLCRSSAQAIKSGVRFLSPDERSL